MLDSAKYESRYRASLQIHLAAGIGSSSTDTGQHGTWHQMTKHVLGIGHVNGCVPEVLNVGSMHYVFAPRLRDLG